MAWWSSENIWIEPISPETRDIPVIFITATYVTRDDREFALNIGATRFIQKPVDLDEFLKTIGELLSETKPVMVEPLNELYFYEGYRKRLGAKLSQKALQISRDELLLKSTYSDEERQQIQASLRQAISERDELAHLLEQVNEQLGKFANTQ